MEFLGYLTGVIISILILFAGTALYSRRLTRSLLREIEITNRQLSDAVHKAARENELARQHLRELERVVQELGPP